MTTRRIFFRELVVQASIGMLEHEKNAPQPLHIDADFDVIITRQAVDEDVSSVLDYRLLRETILEECTRGHTHLLETLIERLADRLMNDFPDIKRLHLSLSKPTIFDDCAEVGIAISRERLQA